MTKNSKQPQWNIYEAVVLLDACLETQKKERPKSHVIKDVSVALRQMATNQGLVIDEVFRNENGISYQLQSMESAYKGVKVYVPATRLFNEVVSIYNEDRDRFESLLEEARRMISKQDNKKKTESIEFWWSGISMVFDMTRSVSLCAFVSLQKLWESHFLKATNSSGMRLWRLEQ